MGICGSAMKSVPIKRFDEVTEKEDPSTRSSANVDTNRAGGPSPPRPAHRCSGFAAWSLLTRAPPFSAIEGLKPSKATVVLVTGAARGVGGDVAQALINAGYSVNRTPKPETLHLYQTRNPAPLHPKP